MAPDKRERKKPERFDPHPPGSKHQMMSARSKKVKDKKLARERMQVLRKGDSSGVTDQGQGHAQNDDTDKKSAPTEKKDSSNEETVENCDKN